MPNAWNAALLIDNLADRAVLSASSSASLTPPTRMQDPHVARKMRFGGVTGQHVVADLGSVFEIDSVAVLGLNLTAAGTSRVCASLADSSGSAGDAYDGGGRVGAVDPAYCALIDLLPAPVAARYVRIEVSDASLDRLEAGRLVIGLREQLAFNFAFGWQRQWVDRSRHTESRGGQVYVDADNRYRVVDISLEALTSAQRHDLIERLDRDVGTHRDILLLLNPSSPHLARDSIWGFTEQVTPVTQPIGWIASSPIYQKSIRIRERL